MYRAAMYLVLLLSVLLVCATHQIIIYQIYFPRMAWSVETLKLNVKANRALWQKCEKSR